MLTTEIARAAGVTAETVRFYTRKGLLYAERDPNNGYKIYQQSAVNRLKFISHARAIGFSLSQIQEIIDKVRFLVEKQGSDYLLKELVKREDK